ncbi:MAG: hypothetical protein JO339_31620 [Alphaproteobacteria bacterium]|nr:hypothetical protein [Alphaproteobacteria bacterium]
MTDDKALVRFNATRHGVLSRYTVLPWEDAEESPGRMPRNMARSWRR